MDLRLASEVVAMRHATPDEIEAIVRSAIPACTDRHFNIHRDDTWTTAEMFCCGDESVLLDGLRQARQPSLIIGRWEFGWSLRIIDGEERPRIYYYSYTMIEADNPNISLLILQRRIGSSELVTCVDEVL